MDNGLIITVMPWVRYRVNTGYEIEKMQNDLIIVKSKSPGVITGHNLQLKVKRIRISVKLPTKINNLNFSFVLIHNIFLIDILMTLLLSLWQWYVKNKTFVLISNSKAIPDL